MPPAHCGLNIEQRYLRLRLQPAHLKEQVASLRISRAIVSETCVDTLAIHDDPGTPFVDLPNRRSIRLPALF